MIARIARIREKQLGIMERQEEQVLIGARITSRQSAKVTVRMHVENTR